jgi:hypothetical protein
MRVTPVFSTQSCYIPLYVNTVQIMNHSDLASPPWTTRRARAIGAAAPDPEPGGHRQRTGVRREVTAKLRDCPSGIWRFENGEVEWTPG